MGILAIIGIIFLVALFSDSSSGAEEVFMIAEDLAQVAQIIVLRDPRPKEVAASILKRTIAFMTEMGLSTSLTKTDIVKTAMIIMTIIIFRSL